MESTTHFVTMFVIVSTAIMLTLGVITFMLVYRAQKRKLFHQLRLNKVKTDYEQSLVNAKLEIHEVAFRHIARELHDNVKNMLTLAKLDLNTMHHVIEEGDKAKLQSAIEYLSQAIRDVGHLSRSLNTDQIMRDGLLNVLRREIEGLKMKDWFSIDMQVLGREPSLNTERELLIFRIIQEALNNVIIHAKPATVHVLLHYHENSLELEIKDDGKGFEHTQGKQQGAGLFNMQARAKVLNGKLAITSEPGMGTTVHLSVPYEAIKS